MVDLRADTASSSDKAEFTETEDRSRTHHGSTLGTDPSGKAAQREGLKTVFGGTDAQEGVKMLREPGRIVAGRDPSAWGRTSRAAIDDTTRK